MNRGFYTDIAGLNTQLNRMEIVSNNLANANTDGFKRRTTVVSPFHKMMLVNLNGNASSAQRIGNIHQGSQVTEVATDFSAGVYAKTGNMGDLAITGEGFFTLEDDDGNRYYTRNGKFFIEPDRYIYHGTGLRLLGEGGPVQVPGDEFSVSDTGEISAAGRRIDRILITRFDNPNLLAKSGNSLYSATGGVQAIPVENPQIYQEHLEKSNVDSTKEMITAMEVLRAYEVGHKMAQAHDRLVDLAVREVGKIK